MSSNNPTILSWTPLQWATAYHNYVTTENVNLTVNFYSCMLLKKYWLAKNNDHAPLLVTTEQLPNAAWQWVVRLFIYANHHGRNT